MPTPFTTTPDVSIDGFGNTWVYIGSGKYYSDADKTDTSPQILMGLKDTGVTVAKSAMDDRTSHATTGTVIDTTTACLYDESQGTFAKQKLVTAIKLGGTSALPAPSAKGWYIPLSGGERVISRPLAVGGLVDFLSYKPYGDACSSGGETSLYALDYLRGIAPPIVALRTPEVTSGVTSGTVTVKKSIRLGPGAPPSGEAIVISPPKEGKDERRKKIQVSTGVVTEAVNKPSLDTGTQIIHWLNK